MPRRKDLEDLAALADGSLQGKRRAEVEAHVAASSELTELLAIQRQSVHALRGLGIAASPELRGRIDAERRRTAIRRRGWARAGARAVAWLVALAALVRLRRGRG